ncbi:hypothetical protein Tco_0666417 [Tanacetum coccineum]
MSKRLKSSKDKDSLGDHEDASKQGRSIEDIDKDADVSLADDTQVQRIERCNIVLKISDAPYNYEEITLVNTLFKSKQQTKVVTIAATTTTTTTRPKLIGVVDNTQAMIEADFELAQRLQTEEQEEITIEERSRLFVELMNKRKKHFAMLRAEEKRRKPPTKAQKRNLMSTYLKNMGGYKHNQLKSKSYEEIQKLFDNEMRRVNTFIPMDSGW